MPAYCIPKKVIAVSRPVEECERDYTGETVRYQPTFVVDADSEKMLETAKKWAQYGKGYSPTYPEPECTEMDNEPFTHMYLVRVEHREEGGLAYKVVTEHGFMVDLREDEFLEAVFNHRIQDGYIYGEYVWSRGGSQMRLVRVGSDLYNERVERGQRGSLKKISPKNLVVGNLYRQKDQSSTPEMFVGRVRLDGKLLFAWRGYYGSCGLTAWCNLTSSHSFVEDLGPCPDATPDTVRDGIITCRRQANWTWEQHEPDDLEWK